LQKIKKLILIVCMLIVCTSCTKVEYSLEIAKDGSANFNYLIEVEEEKYENYKKKYDTTIEMAKKSLKESGFSVNQYLENEMVKLESKMYLTDITKLNEYSTLLNPINSTQPIISHEKNIFFEKYVINGKIDLTNYSENPKDDEKDKLVSESLPITFTIKAPVNVKKTNANENVDKQLTWNLKYDEENIIEVEYVIMNTLSVGIVFFTLFVVIQIITIQVVMKLTMSRKKEEDTK